MENKLNHREIMLDTIFDISRHQNDKRSKQIAAKGNTVELILLAWAFIFAGIGSLYQVRVLNTNNIQQTITLLLPILISLLLCVRYGMYTREENDPPHLGNVWETYVNAVNSNFLSYNSVNLKEQLVNAYIEAEGLNRSRLANIAQKLSWASALIIIELIMILIFVIFKDLSIHL